jgi:putative PIN family toxin of toxin-antitoxin system
VAVRPDPRRLIVVLDTNALVRVALAKSPLARSLRLALEHGDFILLVSEEILIELGRVLRYARIASRHALTEAVITEFEQAIRTTAVAVPGLYLVSKIEADPSDDKFLACALEGAADCIISEDPHLRDLKTYQGIQIISMAQFAEKLGLSAARPA